MKVLAIEYSSAQRSVGTAEGNQLGHFSNEVEVVETGGRAANTFRMVDAVLAQAGLEREQIDCLAIGIGPGSYTGIRSAISTAQGWQLAADIKLLGISSADVIAAEAEACGLSGPLVVVIDAQRGEYYAAEYDLGKSASPQPSVPMRIVNLEEALRMEGEGKMLVGPQAPKGAVRFRVFFPRASVLARLALGRYDFQAGEALAPIYLRETTFVKLKR